MLYKIQFPKIEKNQTTLLKFLSAIMAALLCKKLVSITFTKVSRETSYRFHNYAKKEVICRK